MGGEASTGDTATDRVTGPPSWTRLWDDCGGGRRDYARRLQARHCRQGQQDGRGAPAVNEAAGRARADGLAEARAAAVEKTAARSLGAGGVQTPRKASARPARGRW